MRHLSKLLYLSNLLVSCQRVEINMALVGEDSLVFPEGKVMSKHQTLENGFEYEVENVYTLVLLLAY